LPPKTIERIDERASELGVDRSETVRRLLDETLRSTVWYKEPRAVTEASRNVIQFLMGVGPTEFLCEVSFEAIELLANRHGAILNTTDEHLAWAEMLQPELKDIGLRKMILRQPALITTEDVDHLARR